MLRVYETAVCMNSRTFTLFNVVKFNRSTMAWGGISEVNLNTTSGILLGVL